MTDNWRVLHGFGLSGYRSFGAETSIVGPLGKINLIAGQNNVGKTNVLHFIRDVLRAFPGGFALSELDYPRLAGVKTLRMVRAVPRQQLASDLEVAETLRSSGANGIKLLRWLASEALGDRDHDLAWFPYSAPLLPAGEQMVLALDPEFLANLARTVEGEFGANLLSNVSSDLTNVASDSINNLRAVLQRLAGPPQPLDVLYLPTQRVLTAEGDMDEASGRGLIRKLQQLQSPGLDREADRDAFDALEVLVKRVLDDPGAKLEVPAEATTVLITTSGRRLPISSLGTGIAQTIVLAAVAITRKRTLLLMEEPEASLHPRLQRHLLQFMANETNNQYVIATHSASFLDSELGRIFHIQLDSIGLSGITACPEPQAISAVCHDLGYRPSDLLQSNCVIWVEGPSDRVYVLHWLAKVAPDLREDFDFSIMFYGGSLLSHLSASDVEVDQFISLRRLNRHHAVLIDSDRASEDAPINATKRRIVAELADSATESFSWVTPGRTIENLIPPNVLAEAVKNVHPELESGFVSAITPFDPPLDLGTGHRPDKVAIATAACELWPLDEPLSQAILELADKLTVLITASSGGPASS